MSGHELCLKVTGTYTVGTCSCVSGWISNMYFQRVCLQHVVFVASAVCICLQCQKCSSPGRLHLCAVWYHIWSWVAETVSLLTINSVVFYLEVHLEIPDKEEKLRKTFCKVSFQVGMDLKQYRNKAGTEECKKTTLLRNYGGKTGKKTTLHLLCIFCRCKVQCRPDAT